MAPKRKRVTSASPLSDVSTARASALAPDSAGLLGHRSADISAALAKLAELEAEFSSYDGLAHIKRWPPIYGLSLALAFSTVAWYAFARLVMLTLS